MAKQTLRKEIRKSVLDILESCIGYWESKPSANVETLGDIADKIADIQALKPKPAFNFAQADPFWGLAMGVDIGADAIEEKKLLDEALKDFETCLQLPATWNWFPPKKVEEDVMRILRDHVVKEYAKDRLIFQKYQTWRTSPFARGAISNLSLKRDPSQFVYSWSDFLASYEMNKSKLPKVVINKDDNDAPITY